MKRLGLSVIIAAGLTFPALADPPQLGSDYVWTYNETCLISPSGFSVPPGLAPNGAAALGQTYSASSADTGIEHFNADGTGFVKGGGITVFLGSPPSSPAGAINPAGTFSFQFTYVFNSDDTFTMTTVPSTFVGYDATGKIPVVALNGNQWVGKASEDGKSHTLTTVTPFIQVFSLISPPTILFYQMCRSNVVGFASSPAN